MASDRDDRWDDDRDDRRGDRRDDSPDEIRRRAAAKLSTPAILMIASAVFMFVFLGLNLVILATGYDLTPAMLDWMADMQPPGKAKDDLVKQAQDARTRDRTAEYVQSAIFSVVQLAFNVLVLLGGLKMKSMKNHTLAMVGSIAAIIPLNSCCCIGIPVGIWSLVTLMNADVKAAFALNAGGRTARREELDEGWGEAGR